MEAVQFIHDENTPTDALLLTENKISVSRLFCMPYLSGILFVSDLRFKHDKTIYGYLIKRGALKFFLLHIDPTLLMCKGLRLQKDLSVKPWTLILDRYHLVTCSLFILWFFAYCMLLRKIWTISNNNYVFPRGNIVYVHLLLILLHPSMSVT